jgi:hypothetical protein
VDVIISIIAVVVAAGCMVAIFVASSNDRRAKNVSARRYSRTDTPQRKSKAD